MRLPVAVKVNQNEWPNCRELLLMLGFDLGPIKFYHNMCLRLGGWDRWFGDPKWCRENAVATLSCPNIADCPIVSFTDFVRGWFR